MVMAGWGIGCLPEHLVARQGADGELWPLPPYDGVADIDLHLMWHREGRASVAETTFIEFFLTSMAKVPMEHRLTTGIDVADAAQAPLAFDDTP